MDILASCTKKLRAIYRSELFMSYYCCILPELFTVGRLLFIDFQNAVNTSLNKDLSLFFLEEEWSGM